MNVMHRPARVGLMVMCLMAMAFGQTMVPMSGNSRAQATPTFYLPWEAGSVWRITNGNGTGEHADAANRYGFDAAPDPGRSTNLVTAIAGGRILGFQNDIPGSALFYVPHAGNCMLIQHDDGTVSIYAHLAAGSIPEGLRQDGAEVRGGMVIGAVGDTGYASGVHLHWSLLSEGHMYTEAGYETCAGTSIPSQYADNDAELIEDGGVPQTGRYYASTNPGQGASVDDRADSAGNTDIVLAVAQGAPAGEVGRPPLPSGNYRIVRLPFNGEHQITQVPGCGSHTLTNVAKKYNEMNVRAFDFDLYLEDVLAAGEGNIVVAPYTDPAGALIVEVDHGGGVTSYYVHLSEARVNVGDHVAPGDVIGVSGNTGLGAAYHLHFAVTVGGDPATTGHAANINSLPGIPWDRNQLNDDGYVTNCDLQINETAVGSAPSDVSTDATDDAGMIPVVGYDRGVAVAAAAQNLSDGDRFEEDSAMYVSDVLWAGGLPRSDVWTDDSTDSALLAPESTNPGPTDAAANADDLVSYLTETHSQGTYSVTLATRIPIDWSDNDASGAELGDVIAYDWEGDGIIDHVAVVTNINDSGYPEVSQHSPTQENQYWSYSVADRNFIEKAYPGSAAYLIQISPLTVPNV